MQIQNGICSSILSERSSGITVISGDTPLHNFLQDKVYNPSTFGYGRFGGLGISLLCHIMTACVLLVPFALVPYTNGCGSDRVWFDKIPLPAQHAVSGATPFGMFGLFLRA